MNTQIEQLKNCTGALTVQPEQSIQKKGEFCSKELMGLVVGILAESPDEVSLHLQGSMLLASVKIAGFGWQEILTRHVEGALGDTFAGIETISCEGRIYEVSQVGNGFSIYKSELNLRTTFGWEECNRVLSSAERCSGVLYITGNGRSNLNTYFGKVSREVKPRFGNWMELTCLHGELIASNDAVSFPVSDLVQLCAEFKPSLLLIKDNSKVSHTDIFALANMGILVIVKLQGHNSLHLYNELFRSIEHSLLSNHLIGVSSLSCAPVLDKSLIYKQISFEEYEQFEYYRKIEAAPLNSELVVIYGGNNYDRAKISESIDVIDFIEPPKNIKSIALEDGTAFDYYGTFRGKLKGVDFCCDKLMRLIRTKITAIDLVDRFNSRN